MEEGLSVSLGHGGMRSVSESDGQETHFLTRLIHKYLLSICLSVCEVRWNNYITGKLGSEKDFF